MRPPLTIDHEPHLLREEAPIAWQVIDGQQVPVEAQYAVASDGTVGFAVGAYNPNTLLTIDPVTLVYSTYLGGTSADRSSCPWIF